jgi:hypothetical protein
MGRWVCLFASVVPLSTGCATAMVASMYEAEYHCPEGEVEVEPIAGGRYRVKGCGKTVMYQCYPGNVCDNWQVDPPNDRSEETRVAATEAPPPESTTAPNRSTKEGRKKFLLELRLTEKTVLLFSAVPTRENQKVELKLMRVERKQTLASCSLDMMVNGQLVEMPKARSSHAKGLSSLIVELDPDQTNDIGLAQQLAFRACKDRFPIGAEDLRKTHRFVALYREELAWLGDPRRGSTGGFVAPSGGWPEWTPSGRAPEAGLTGSPLAADALFQRLAPSVLVLEVRSASGTAQGSGVAVGPAEVLTNCHVLAGAQKIQLKQKESTWSAALERADPKSDRCVLRASGPPLVPVAGVRSYGDLKVGEPLYALGSPRGLELTLSEGILSGLREEEGLKFVQTTAPISPGSSGGGLFDGRGNLVGITTLVLAGKERLNQALNFALPADSFFLP